MTLTDGAQPHPTTGSVQSPVPPESPLPDWRRILVASPHRVSQAILVGADCFLLDFHKPIKSIGVIRLYQIVKYDNLYTGFNAY